MRHFAKIISESTSGFAGRSASCRVCRACLQRALAREKQARQFALRPQCSYVSPILTPRIKASCKNLIYFLLFPLTGCAKWARQLSRDLLLPEGSQGAAANPREEPEDTMRIAQIATSYNGDQMIIERKITPDAFSNF